MDMIATLLKDGIITFSGTHQLKLSTYQVVPKKTLMGTLNTSDDVTVTFVVGIKPLMLSSATAR